MRTKQIVRKILNGQKKNDKNKIVLIIFFKTKQKKMDPKITKF